MDSEFSEDEFDCLLCDEVVPDAILRAADLLETEALGIWYVNQAHSCCRKYLLCFSSSPQITKQTIEANEYDIWQHTTGLR
jgi:hypothetical protein